MKRYALAISILSCLFLFGCHEDLRDRWVDAMKNCASTDINSKTILYFGPSNNVGPGSVWRETVDDKGNHVDYRLRYIEADLPAPKNFLQRAEDNAFQCRDGRTASFSLSASASATISAFPLSAELSNDFKRAKKVSVTVGGMAWDQIKEQPFEEYFRKTLGPGHPVYEDMNGPNRFVLYRALAVRDLVIDLEFSNEDAASLKAKYTGSLGSLAQGTIGAGISATWKSTNTLSITAPGRSWILGELCKFRPSSGFAGVGATRLQPVNIPKAAILKLELQAKP